MAKNKMMRLIVLNHQPTVPPFMLSALKVAVNRFDKVIYINKRIPTNVRIVPGRDHIDFIPIPGYRKVIAYILSIFEFFSPKVQRLFIKGIKEKGMSSHFLKVLFSHLLYYWSSKSIVQSIIRDQSVDDRTCLLSVWFSSEAYCASRIKQKFPNVMTASMAHSFEIFMSRDPYIPYYFNEEKLQNLDAVYFISRQGFDSFFSEIPDTKLYMDKASVMYLGTYKESDALNKSNDNHSFSICTCSRTIPLKRLDVLCEALALWEDCPITWTHIGFGEDDDKLRSLAVKTETENSKVKIIFKGRLSNEEVKAFYSMTPVDIFINLSTIEGLPISIMEAISFGIPVIATDVGGTREIVDSSIGYLLPAEITPLMVKESLREYYELDDDQKEIYRRNAYMLWQERFKADKNFNRIFDSIISYNQE